MADESKRPNEVILNGVWYPLVGQLSRVLTSVWPEKTVIGDYTKASDPYVESWSIADQRGGVLIEEMDEQKHANRCYWSTCNLGFKGHIILPPLATSVTIADTTGGASASLSCTNSGFETDTTGWEQVGTVTLTRDTVNKHSGSASLALTNMGAGEGVKYAVTWNSSFQGKSVTASMWHRGGTSSEDMHLAIYDGVDTTNGTAVSGDTTFQLMTVTRTLSSSASELSIRAMWDSGAGDHNIDDLMLSGLPVNGDVVKWITFNSKWYMAKGSWLMKLDADGDEFTAVKSDLGAAITDLIATSDYLYIYCGDTAPYWYMNTSETFVQSPGYNNTYGIYWDDKLFKTDSEGQLAYYTTPAS